jgi:RNA polymerase sigma factor (sigma-70 family)
MAGTPLAAVVRQMRRLTAPLPESDHELLRRFAAGRDEAAFARLVERHGPLVLGVCRRILRDTHDSDDAFQATFFVLARKAASVRRAASLAGWLYRVAYRIAVQARAERVRRHLRERQGHDMRRADAPAAAWDDLRPVLDEEVQALPDKYRLPVVLCYLQGRTLTQAAADLGWPRGTVAGRLGRARDLLRERLTRRGVVLSAALLPGAAVSEVVPAALAGATARGAVPFAAGAAGVSAAATLAEAALRALAGTTLKAGAALLLGLALLAAGAGLLAAVMPATEPPAAGPTPRDRPADEARGNVDALGDPLPPGAVARLGTVRLQQGCYVDSLQFSSDGKLLASAGMDNTARLWDVATGKEVRRFRHDALAWMVSALFTPDGKTLLTSGAGGEVYVWDVATGRVLRRLPAAPAGPSCLALSPDGKTLVTWDGNSRTLHLWDWAAGKERRQVEDALPPLAFLPDGKRIAFTKIDDDHGAGRVSCLDLATGESTVLLPFRARSLAFSPDGKLLAEGDKDEAPPHDGFARLWDVATGKERFRLQLGPNLGSEAILSFSPDGKLLATANDDIRLWDVATGKELRRCAARPNVTRCLAFSPDGKALAASGMSGRIQLFDVATGKVREPFARPPDVGRTVLFLPGGRSLLTAERMVVGAGDGAEARVWDAATGKELRHFRCYEEHGSVLPSANGALCAVADDRDDTIRFLQVPSGKELGRLPGKPGRLGALSDDGRKVVATRHEDSVVRLWDVAGGKELQRFDGHRSYVSRTALAPDGATLASVGGNAPDETLRVWDVATGRERWQWSYAPARVAGLVFSPDGKFLATVGQPRRGDAEKGVPGEVRLWDVVTGREVRRWEANDRPVDTAAFSPDGRTLATGGPDAVVYLWEVATGNRRRALRGHDDLILSLSFAPDGRRLASASQDGTVLVWGLTAPPARLSAEELKAGWDALAGEDAAGAYCAVRRLAADPERAVPLLRERLRPARSPDAKRVAGLVADLDSDKFAVREAAAKELATLGDAAVPVLGEALRGRPSPEVARRLRQLLDEADGWPPERLREWRALEILEQAGTPEAREVLKVLADGVPAARLTREARAALGRLTKQPPAPTRD